MRRLFPILAVVAVLSLAAGLVAPGAVLGSLHLLEFAAVVWTHSLAAIDLESTGRRVEMMAISGGLPDWVLAQSEKNRRKTSLYLWVGLPLFPLLTLARAKGLVGGEWLLGLLGLNLAFQVGAFVGEFAIMTAQARLVGDVEGWVASSSQQVAGSGQQEETSF
jgi:hypothetical protein